MAESNNPYTHAGTGARVYCRIFLHLLRFRLRKPFRTRNLREEDHCVRLGPTRRDIPILGPVRRVNWFRCLPTTRDRLAPLLRPKTPLVAAGCIFNA